MIPHRGPLRYLRSLRHDPQEKPLFAARLTGFVGAIWALLLAAQPGVPAVTGVGVSVVLTCYFYAKHRMAVYGNDACHCTNCNRRRLALITQTREHNST